MNPYDLIFLAAAAWLLWQGYTFLGDRERAWNQYVERQKTLGRKIGDIQRTDDWERTAMLQGIFYTALGTLGILVAIFS